MEQVVPILERFFREYFSPVESLGYQEAVSQLYIQEKTRAFLPQVQKYKESWLSQFTSQGQETAQEGIRRRLTEIKEKARALPKKEREEFLRTMMPEVFGVVAAVFKQVQGIDLRPQQIIGGAAMAEGKVIDMKPAEGKTETFALAMVFSSLTGEPTFLLTRDGYLAYENLERLASVYSFLDIKAAAVCAEDDYYILTKDQQEQSFLAGPLSQAALERTCQEVIARAGKDKVSRDKLRGLIRKRLREELETKMAVSKRIIKPGQQVMAEIFDPVLEEFLSSQEEMISVLQLRRLLPDLLTRLRQRLNERVFQADIIYAEKFAPIHKWMAEAFLNEEERFFAKGIDSWRVFLDEVDEILVDETLTEVVLQQPLEEKERQKKEEWQVFCGLLFQLDELVRHIKQKGGGDFLAIDRQGRYEPTEKFYDLAAKAVSRGLETYYQFLQIKDEEERRAFIEKNPFVESDFLPALGQRFWAGTREETIKRTNGDPFFWECFGTLFDAYFNWERERDYRVVKGEKDFPGAGKRTVLEIVPYGAVSGRPQTKREFKRMTFALEMKEIREEAERLKKKASEFTETDLENTITGWYYPRKTLCLVTMQAFLRHVGFLSGGSATAAAAAEEYRAFYGKETIVIPPYYEREIAREGLRVYETPAEMRQGFMEAALAAAAVGRPVVVIFRDPKDARDFYQELTEKKAVGTIQEIPPGLSPAEEKQRVEKMGDPGMITVATIALGRGVNPIIQNGLLLREVMERSRMDPQVDGRLGRVEEGVGQGEVRVGIHLEDRRLGKIFGSLKEGRRILGKYRDLTSAYKDLEKRLTGEILSEQERKAIEAQLGELEKQFIALERRLSSSRRGLELQELRERERMLVLGERPFEDFLEFRQKRGDWLTRMASDSYSVLREMAMEELADLYQREMARRGISVDIRGVGHILGRLKVIFPGVYDDIDPAALLFDIRGEGFNLKNQLRRALEKRMAEFLGKERESFWQGRESRLRAQGKTLEAVGLSNLLEKRSISALRNYFEALGSTMGAFDLALMSGRLPEVALLSYLKNLEEMRSRFWQEIRRPLIRRFLEIVAPKPRRHAKNRGRTRVKVIRLKRE